MAVASLRSRPSHAAEQVSQILLGESFTVTRRAEQGEWLEVRADADGYRGWVRSWHVVLLSETQALSWARGRCWQVRRLHAVVRAQPEADASPVMPLPWGALLLAVRRPVPRGWISVELPSGQSGFVRRTEVVPRERRRAAASPRELERTAREFLGVPYEWGGRSSWGMDCSGLVQTVLGWHGLALPRDARQQARALGLGSRPLRTAAGARWTAGTLAFFGPRRGAVTHVGLVGRGGVLLHALGQVRADRLQRPSEPTIRQLVSRFRGAAAPTREG